MTDNTIHYENLVKNMLMSANWRGHDMIETEAQKGILAVFECRKCHKLGIVITKPMPNQIEISGRAVALNCDT